MNNFLYLRDIDTSALLKVEVVLCEHGYVKYRANINGVPVAAGKSLFHFDLLSPITLQVVLEDFTEGTSGIEITNLSVNELEVLPVYQQVASSGNNYIDHLGLWELSLPTPFYNWYHNMSGQGWLLMPNKY